MNLGHTINRLKQVITGDGIGGDNLRWLYEEIDDDVNNLFAPYSEEETLKIAGGLLIQARAEQSRRQRILEDAEHAIGKYMEMAAQDGEASC